MRTSAHLVLLFCVSLPALSWGGQSPLLEEEKDTKHDVVKCTDPRPQMCTKELTPVCATRDTGIRCVTTPCPSSEQQTYNNACSACSDPDVYSYHVGACPDGDG